MQICETWSITAERIRAFFLSQNEIRHERDDRFSCASCEILLTPLPARQVGCFLYPQTRVEFTGSDEDTEAIHRRFVLQFISAGG